MTANREVAPKKDAVTVNGYQIREAMKHWHNRRELANSQYPNSLYVFEGDSNIPVTTVIENYALADENYARLQELQQWYNARVKITASTIEGDPTEMSLSYAVKVLGGAGRMEKMWRDSCAEKKDRYGGYNQDRERDKDKEYAKRSISVSDAMIHADAAARYAMHLRSAIARANNTNVGLSDALCPITPDQWTKLLGA